TSSRLISNLPSRRLGLTAASLPFRVPRGELADALKAFERLPVRGFSVTIPHKEAAAELAARKDATVEQTLAANTLVRGPDGLGAYNTDYQGVIDALKAFLPAFAQAPRPPADPGAPALTPAPPPQPAEPALASIASKVVLVLGAGGVARAVAHALHREGALVTITNRTAERAQALAAEVGCRTVEWNARHGVLSDVVINCTSVGMHPNVDESPLHPSYLKPGLVVFDTVYTPEQTLLIKEARERGGHTITGVELFVRQAALQFRLFTAREAPLELFRKVVKRALSPVTIRSEDDEG